MASENVAFRYSLRAFSRSPDCPVASLRSSNASMLLSPRTLASACFHTIAAKSSDTPAFSTNAWPTLMKNSRNRELVVHHAGGEEDALRVARGVVGMANRAVAQFRVVALRDAGRDAFADRER